MKKKHIILIVILVFLIALGLIIYFSMNNDDNSGNNDLPKDNSEVNKLDKLQSILENSEYFLDSEYVQNPESNMLTIDSKYDIYIKNGYYLMNVKDTKDETVYCNIIDAIEMNLGLEKGKSIETCKETLKGSMNLGGINVEFFDTYKVLTVNSNELSSIYTNENSHRGNDLIYVDEVNYDIKIGDYLFTSMSTGFSPNAKLYSVCGHIYNSKKKNKNFIVHLYDESKTLITEKVYNFINDTGRYETFCVDFDLEYDKVKYYSIVFEE